MTKGLLFLPFLSLFLIHCHPDSKEEIRDFTHAFDEYNVEGAFILYDLQQNQYIRHNPERCNLPVIPASTFKIFNSLVSLETGAIEDANTLIEWDGVESWNKEWNRDHTLQSAFQVSCVPCYQQLARKIGAEQMQHYIDQHQYGNQDISGGIVMFWLTGNLRISPDEQVALLKKLYANELGFSAHTMQIVRDIMVIEQDSTYTLRGKTGWGIIDDTNYGWFVGYIEKDENVYFFATNIETDQPEDSFAQARKAISLNILKELGILG
nr:classD [uncultured bacterium]